MGKDVTVLEESLMDDDIKFEEESDDTKISVMLKRISKRYKHSARTYALFNISLALRKVSHFLNGI